MKLDAITARVRLRPGMRATDFGIALARRWWTTYMPAWCIVTIPFFLVAAALIYFDVLEPIIVVMGLWWLKPLWDRAILFVLSRSFFGEEMTLSKVISYTVKSWFRWPALAQITLLRLIPIRGTFDPVLELERPRISESFKRYSNLLGGFDAHGLFLATVMEWVLVASAFIVIAWTLPETLEYDAQMIEEALFGEIENSVMATLAVPIYWVALSLVEPFFVATGFACYINRRVELEGWDIELTFRRMAERLRKRTSQAIERAAMVFLAASFVALSLFGVPPSASAQDAYGESDVYDGYESDGSDGAGESGEYEGYDDYDPVAHDSNGRVIERGHYDIDANWVEGPGYYDESGAWVDVDGYFDADGNFVEEREMRTVGDDDRYVREVEDPQARVAEILAGPEFGEMVTEEVWQLKDFDTDEDEEKPEKQGEWVVWLASLLEILAFGVTAAVILGLIYLMVKRFGGFGGDAKVSEARDPTAVVLPDGRRVHLPEDWLEQVLPEWHAGKRILALSLFYRGALTDLKRRHGIKVPDSATTRETVRIVKRAGGPHALVREIGGLWTREVYAGRGPETADVERALTAYRAYLSTAEAV